VDVARHDSRFTSLAPLGIVFAVQSQVCLPLVLVRSMAAKAICRQNWKNIARKLDRIFGPKAF
jgi:hypothetical protein